MKSLYISQQGCYLCQDRESVLVKKQESILTKAQLPLLEQILIFGKSQATTQVIRSCLWRQIPIVYLSRMGYCYGRILPIERGYRQLSRYQQQLLSAEQLLVARAIVAGKLKNSRVLLQRQQRRRSSDTLSFAIQSLDYLSQRIAKAQTNEKVMGLEGAGSAHYFSAFGECLDNRDFVFVERSRRPPGNPVNAMLSFGYQVLWNHLLSLAEIQGLDPYFASLHQGSDRHAALASDLVEEFRAPIVDSLVLYLVNRRVMDAAQDFEYHQGGCYLNDTGRQKYLQAFVQRMEEPIQTGDGGKQPRWDLLSRQVRRYKQWVCNPAQGYQPYLIR